MFFPLSISVSCQQVTYYQICKWLQSFNHIRSGCCCWCYERYELQRYYGNQKHFAPLSNTPQSILHPPRQHQQIYISTIITCMCFFVYKCLICSTTKLKHHMYRRPSIDTIGFQWPIIRKLFPRKDETDLIYLDPLFFLKCLLYGKDLIFGFEVEGLLTAC